MSEHTHGRWRGPGAALTRVEAAIRRAGREAIDAHPRLRSPLLRAWGAYVFAYGTVQACAAAPAGGRGVGVAPFKLVTVDPDRIEFLVEPDAYPDQTRTGATFPPPKFKHAGKVIGGDWDALDRRFENTELYRGFEAHFAAGRPWTETRFYRTVVDYVEDGHVLWDCTSEADVARRCRFLDELYESLATRGYRSQAELAAGSFDSPGPTSPSRVLGVVNDEIAVAVGRDGDLLFVDGRNRLAMAKLLGLDAVTVWIMARHEGWQRRRDGLASDPEAALASPLRSHPDLRGVVAHDTNS